MARDWLNVSDTAPRIYYTVGATPQTVFTVPFVFFADPDLLVYVDSVVKTLNVDYTVAGKGEETGGRVTFLSAQSNCNIAIVRDISIALDTHIPSFGPLDVGGINLQFARQVAIDQQIASKIVRSVRLQESDPTSEMYLPLIEDRRGKLLAFDQATGDATPSVNTLETFDQLLTGALVAQAGFNSLVNVSTYASLRALVPIPGTVVFMNGFSSAMDGGEGIFRWDALSTAPHNAGTIVQPALGGSGRWIRANAGDFLEAGWFGVKRDASNSNAGFALALAAAKANDLPLLLPAGDILLSSGFLLDWHYAKIIGRGSRLTRIIFDPQVDDFVGLEYFKAGDSNGLFVGVLAGLSIYCSAGNTKTKTAIRLSNTSRFTMHDVNVQQWEGSGTGDVALCCAGRELTEINSCTFVAELPVLLRKNPERVAFGNLDCDHLHFHNLYLICRNNSLPCIRAETGMNISNLLFDGFQSWNLGLAGFVWNDTDSTGSSVSIAFHNVRHEQSPVGAYSIYINKVGVPKLFGLTISNLVTGVSGVYLRGVRNTRIDGISFLNIHGDEYGLNAHGLSCDTISLSNCFWQTGTQAFLPHFAARSITGRMEGGAGGPARLPTSGELVSTNYSFAGEIKGRQSPGGQQAQEWIQTVTVANGGTYLLEPFASFTVSHALIEVISNSGHGGAVGFGSGGSFAKMYGTSNFSISAPTDNLVLAYSSDTAIVLTNNLGSTMEVTIRVLFAAPALF